MSKLNVSIKNLKLYRLIEKYIVLFKKWKLIYILTRSFIKK